jgi:hypothetical protein
MKHKWKFTFCGLAFCLNLYAQDKTGVYLTSSDYLHHRLSYESDCNSAKHAIKVHGFLSNRYFKVVYKDQKQFLQKNEVYGYVDCDGKTFRFYQNSEYNIIEAGAINIYTQKEYVGQYKARNQALYTYYFSVALDSPIILLNIRNIKKVFSNNDKFQDLLDVYFQTLSVTAYDDLHKMYKVNYLYSQSIK